MILIDLTLRSPEENLALDETLLERCVSVEDPEHHGEVLRFWESPVHFVVLGISGKLHVDVDIDACARDGVPVLRRVSGGGTVLQGPGCLNYALILSLDRRRELRDLRRSYGFILEGVAGALALPGMAPRGTSDIALGDLKISGNAQKRTRDAILHHGTILHGLDRGLVARWLREPEKQPEYRLRRRHEDFLGEVPLAAGKIKARIRDAFGARPGPFEAPDLRQLVAERYANAAWTARL